MCRGVHPPKSSKMYDFEWPVSDIQGFLRQTFVKFVYLFIVFCLCWSCQLPLSLQETQLLLGDRATRKHTKDSWSGRGNDNLGWNDLQMYFKVIKNGTNRKLVYDFLLVVYRNFCRITHRFWEMWCETVQWPWNMPKVINSRITWKLSCDHVCKMFGRQWTDEAKIAILNDPTLIWRPLSSEPPGISA